MPRPAKNVLFSKHEVGGRIRRLRQEQGMTQVELAEALGITQSNVSAIERGTRSLTVHQVVKLARALEASTDQILDPTSKSSKKANGGLTDRRFVRRLKKLEQLPKRDQQALFRTIDAYLSKVS